MGELDLQSDIALARQALRKVYMHHPGELSSVEQGLVEAISILIKAFDEVTKEEDKDLEDLDSLYFDVFGHKSPSSSSDFVISFPEIGLSIDEIWPDGDAPDEPNINDVIDVMKKSFSPLNVAKDWNLIDSLYVNGVEWNGS